MKLLTPREREIAELRLSGLHCKEVGEKLGISHNTVKSVMRNIYTKYEVSNLMLLHRAMEIQKISEGAK